MLSTIHQDKLNFVPASVFLYAVLRLNEIGDLTIGVRTSDIWYACETILGEVKTMRNWIKYVKGVIISSGGMKITENEKSYSSWQKNPQNNTTKPTKNNNKKNQTQTNPQVYLWNLTQI